MKSAWLGIALAGIALVVAADPALARKRHHKPAPQPARCMDAPYQFTWGGLLFNGRPQPNGCAPAVHEYGYYIGQDPDPNIRFQLQRDPATGYGSGLQR
jgi:hypothetical protein